MPCTIEFTGGGEPPRRILCEDEYEEVRSRLNQVSNEASPIIHVTVDGEEVTVVAQNVVLWPGDKR